MTMSRSSQRPRQTDRRRRPAARSSAASGVDDGAAVARVDPGLGRRPPIAGGAPAPLPEALRRAVHGQRHQPGPLVGQGRRRRRWSWARASSRWRRSRRKINVVNGLFNKHATGVGIHPGQTGNILSGAPLQKGAELNGGISIDQVLANHIGEETVAAQPGAGLRAADHRLPRDQLLDGLQLAHLLAERRPRRCRWRSTRRWPSTACSTTAAAGAT